MPNSPCGPFVLTASLALAALARCSSGAPATAASPPTAPPVAELPSAPVAQPPAGFERLLSSATSAYAEPTELVARDAAAWRSLWAATAPNRAGGAEPPPAVDFAREMVVLVATGTHPTGGHGVRVDAVEPAPGGGAVVRYTVTSPGEGCMSAQMLTAPVDVVRAPRVAGAVRFEARRATAPC